MSAVGLDDPLQDRRCCERGHGNEEDVSTEKADSIPLQLLIKFFSVVQLAFGQIGPHGLQRFGCGFSSTLLEFANELPAPRTSGAKLFEIVLTKGKMETRLGGSAGLHALVKISFSIKNHLFSPESPPKSTKNAPKEAFLLSFHR